jgi:hypothetical protein
MILVNGFVGLCLLFAVYSFVRIFIGFNVFLAVIMENGLLGIGLGVLAGIWIEEVG